MIIVLAGSKIEQVAQGQRAFLQIAGKPIVGGTKIYKATERLSKIARATKIRNWTKNSTFLLKQD